MGSGNKGVSINLMDVLKELDRMAKRVEELEKESYWKRDY